MINSGSEDLVSSLDGVSQMLRLDKEVEYTQDN